MMDCKHGILPSKRCCNGCNEMDNMLYKCNQEIVKQTCKVEQLEQQLAAANARVVELEYKLMAQTETALQEKAKREQAEAQCALLKQENSKLASAAIEQPPYKADLQKRLDAAEAVCTAVKECLPTIHHMANWQKVKEWQ